MSLSPATIILIFAAVAIAAMLLNRNTRRRDAERAEEYRKAAALRGWQMEFDHSEYRYFGTTEGVRWTMRIGHDRSSDRTPSPARWQTTAVRLDDGVLIVWPDFGPGMDAIITPGVPQFVLDLAMKSVSPQTASPYPSPCHSSNSSAGGSVPKLSIVIQRSTVNSMLPTRSSPRLRHRWENSTARSP